MSERKPAVAWMSDIDGTAIELAKRKISLRNAMKYPLSPIENFHEFYRGVVESGPFLGYASARHVWRRRATNRSLSQLDIKHESRPQDMAKLAGSLLHPRTSEAKKARHILGIAASYDAFGFIEDRPHRLGNELITAIKARNWQPNSRPVNILLGAAPHNRTGEDIISLNILFDCAANKDVTGEISRIGNTGLRIGESALHFVRLQEYSYEEGL